MNTIQVVMAALEEKGSERTRKTMARHGASDNLFGVKIADLKLIAKKIEGKQEVASKLYETGNYDANQPPGDSLRFLPIGDERTACYRISADQNWRSPN